MRKNAQGEQAFILARGRGGPPGRAKVVTELLHRSGTSLLVYLGRELVAQAEQAVSGVKDAELRRVAFERVLEDLLGTHPAASASTSTSTSARQATSTVARGGSGGRERHRARQSQAKRSGPQAYIEELSTEGFFKKQKTISEVKAELENRGHHIPMTSLSGPLQKLCQKKTLRRQKVDANGGKKTYGYSMAAAVQRGLVRGLASYI